MPVDPGLLPVSLSVPGGDPFLDAGEVDPSVVQSLTGEHAEFYFGDVRPAAMFRREHQFQAIHHPLCFLGREGGIQGTDIMGIQVVADRN